VNELSINFIAVSNSSPRSIKFQITGIDSFSIFSSFKCSHIFIITTLRLFKKYTFKLFFVN